MTAQAVRDIIERRALQAGVAMPVRPHDLRRSFVTDLLEAGVDIGTVARMAGHDTVTTTQRYDRRGEQAKRKAALSLHVPYVRRTLG
jgi:site-specific recombinase XerD